VVTGSWQNIEFTSRTIVLWDVEAEPVKDIIEYILRINYLDFQNIKEKGYKIEPIRLMINTYGGETYYAFGLMDIIEKSITPIHTYGVGSVMSSGLAIFLAGKKRYAYKSCTFMYHQVSTKYEGKAKGQEDDIKECNRIMAIFDKHITKNCKITQKQLDNIKANHKDWYFGSKEALKLDIIEKIL
jgi:ATP-dependent Clp protease protease subunit